jgi:glutathione peroxidase
MLSLLLLLACAPLDVEAAAPPASPVSVSLTRLDNSALPAAELAGKVVLFVNVASQCGNTPQYAGLEALYTQYAAKGFTIVGVPCNQFGSQEPGSPEQIASFCKLNYGVTFPLLSKQEVNGAGRSPLYQSLVQSKAGGGTDITWNFEKFLVGRNGEVVARFGPRVQPNDPTLVAAIEQALAAK